MRNKNGFAITTLIYGLSIMGILVVAILMGTMSTNRANNRALAKAIEQELNRGSKVDMFYDGAKIPDADDFIEEEFVIPPGQGGWYRIELWGSSGPGSNANGAYTSGLIKLKDTDTLHFFLGKARSGKETDVRITGGDYVERASYDTRIMVAAGGGSQTKAYGGTLEGYNSTMIANGGDTTTSTLYGLNSSSYNPPNILKTYRSLKGVNGVGDGYYASTTPSSGGVSFISGFGGCKALLKGSVSSSPTYRYSKNTYNENTDLYSYGDYGRYYYFVDGQMFAGVNEGAGKASIEKITATSSLPILNTKLNMVSKIYDCVSGSTNNVTKISAMTIKMDGSYDTEVDIALGKEISDATDPQGKSGTKCKVVDLEGSFDLTEVAVFHDNDKAKDLLNHRIIVISNGTTYAIKDMSSYSSKSITTTLTGERISAFQFDSTGTIPSSGIYYIKPVLVENKFLTTNTSWLNATYPSGQINQRWTIEINPDNSYKILELSKNRALEQISGGMSCATTQAYKGNTNQKWNFIPVKNGSYVIKNVSTGNYLYYSPTDSKISLSNNNDNSIIYTYYRFNLYKLDLNIS